VPTKRRYNGPHLNHSYPGGGNMDRVVLALSTVLTATTLACVSLSVVPETSLAAAPPLKDEPSQGTFTEGTAGPNEPSLVADTPPSTSGAEYTAARDKPTRKAIVRKAKRFIGTRYKYATCTKSRMSCTCLTKRTWAKFGRKLPMSERGQWKKGKRVAKSDLRRGDIVFFKEAGRRNPITHVGIYSGKGNLVHASNYFNKVVESKMRYIKGYFGAKRLKLR
jgi:cell wall-associated NlpC family hydrolase